MRLQPASEHPHGLQDAAFNALFTTDRPVVFAYHGYPTLIHRLTYRRRNHGNIHVRGYKEEGTTTTPFDMVVRNNMDRYQLAIDSLARLPHGKRNPSGSRIFEQLARTSLRRAAWEDLPEIQNWRWSG